MKYFISKRKLTLLLSLLEEQVDELLFDERHSDNEPQRISRLCGISFAFGKIKRLINSKENFKCELEHLIYEYGDNNNE